MLHHKIQYPNGTIHEGQIDHSKNAEKLDLPRLDGLRVLDLATNDGFFAFWSEWKGAREVVAIDVGSYKDYDWGFDGAPDTGSLQEQNKWENFDFHHRNLSSRVIKREMSVYDIEQLGAFDVVFNYGLVYHLRNPVLALDKCRAVCNGFCVVESEVLPFDMVLPMTLEGGTYSGVGSSTDTFFPSRAALACWMKKACFPHVFIQRPIFKGRGTVVGVVDEKYLPWFSKMLPCDESYWKSVQKASKAILGQLRGQYGG